MAFGIKAALAGHDVTTSPDNKMAFHSEWQTLRIVHEDSFRLPANTFTPQIIYNHNLRYAPFFWVFINRSLSHYPAGTSHYWTTFDPDIVVDEFSLKAPAGGLSTEVTGRFVIFENPLEQSYEAPTDLRGVSTALDIGRFGVQAGEVASDDKRDLTLDSTTRTPLIHTVKSGKVTTANPMVEINHDLAEIPEYFAFAKISGNDYWQIVTNADDSNVSSTETMTTAFLGFNADYSLWVLKQSVVRD